MQNGDSNIAIRSLEDDFNCIVNTYVSREKSMPQKVSAENNIDCPLGELGLIDIVQKERSHAVYKKAIPLGNTFHSWIILAVIQDNAQGRKEIGLNELLTKEKNIGRVFNLDSVVMLDILHRAESTGEIKIVRTAGLDVVHLKNQRTFEDCVKNYYLDISTLD